MAENERINYLTENNMIDKYNFNVDFYEPNARLTILNTI